MNIVKAKKGINRFGLRKYAKISSFTTPNKFYTTGKVRKRNSRSYQYVCDCPHFFNRRVTCKHIKRFKKEERACSSKG